MTKPIFYRYQIKVSETTDGEDPVVLRQLSSGYGEAGTLSRSENSGAQETKRGRVSVTPRE